MSKKLSQEEFEKRLKAVNPHVKVVGKYEGRRKPVQIECLICDHTWDPKAESILRGTQCPECSHSLTSFMEQFVLIAFQKALGVNKVLSRTRNIIQGYELDVYIPQLRLAIEPGSWGWHQQEHKRIRDAEKIELARRFGIEIVTIFDRFDEDEYPHDNWHYVYRWNLGYAKEGRAELIAIIVDMFEKLEITYDFNDDTWKEISNQAIFQSKMTSEAEYLRKVKEKHPEIEIISPYFGYDRMIKAKCSVCGYKWESKTQQLLRHSCPECAKQKRIETRLKNFGTYSSHMGDEEFLNNLAEGHALWHPVEPYRGTNEAILFACNNCEYQEKLKPAAVIYKGRLCPKCKEKIEKRFYELHSPSDFATTLEYYAQLFIMKLNWINPDIELVSNYEGTHNPFTLRCKHCQHEWTLDRFYDLPLHRLFCPECSGVKHDHRIKTSEEFKDEIESLHPGIELLSEYSKASEKVKVRCRTCNHTWFINVTSLNRKNGGKCPRRNKHDSHQ